MREIGEKLDTSLVLIFAPLFFHHGPTHLPFVIDVFGYDKCNDADSQNIYAQSPPPCPDWFEYFKLPEERLLHAIFGEKAADVKDASLTVSGKGGTVMDIRIEYSSDPNRQTMTKSEQRRLAKDFKDEYRRKLAELTSELTHELEKKILDTKLPYPIIDKTPEKNNARTSAPAMPVPSLYADRWYIVSYLYEPPRFRRCWTRTWPR